MKTGQSIPHLAGLVCIGAHNWYKPATKWFVQNSTRIVSNFDKILTYPMVRIKVFPLLKLLIGLSSATSCDAKSTQINLVQFYLNQLIPARGTEPWEYTLESIDGYLTNRC